MVCVVLLLLFSIRFGIGQISCIHDLPHFFNWTVPRPDCICPTLAQPVQTASSSA